MILKPGQNKKGQKIFQLHRFLNTSSQLPAVEKYSNNGSAGNFFGPSYFVTALVMVAMGRLVVILAIIVC